MTALQARTIGRIVAVMRDAQLEEEGDWIEVRRASSSVEADMVRDFLLDHGVRSAVNGDAGGTRLPWQHSMMDIRIVVAPQDVDDARAVLAAMVADTAEHPFRGAPPAPKEDDEEPLVPHRSRVAAAMLALLVPIGAGHFYARHGAAGTILCAGVVGSFLGIALGQRGLAVTWALLLAFDVIGSFFAVRRFNERRVPAEAVQRQVALGAVVVAFGIGWFAGFS